MMSTATQHSDAAWSLASRKAVRMHADATSPFSTIRCCMEGATSSPIPVAINTCPRTVHVARWKGQVGKFFLENAIDLEAEKNLGSQHQEPGFIQGFLDLSR